MDALIWVLVKGNTHFNYDDAGNPPTAMSWRQKDLELEILSLNAGLATYLHRCKLV